MGEKLLLDLIFYGTRTPEFSVHRLVTTRYQTLKPCLVTGPSMIPRSNSHFFCALGPWSFKACLEIQFPHPRFLLSNVTISERYWTRLKPCFRNRSLINLPDCIGHPNLIPWNTK